MQKRAIGYLTTLVSGLCVPAIVCAQGTPAGADAGGAAENFKLEEVTVTAQRREQNLQEVPVSITAFTGDSLQQAGIKNATDYLALTPNVSYSEDSQSGSRGMGISIRGVGNLVTGENAFINSVGIYIDEFSVTSVPNQVANPQLPDIDRVEVLRGPQGTYFGRNSLGGALNITTRKPTDRLEGEVSVGAEDFDEGGEQYSFSGVLNLPVSDTFRARGVFYYEDSSGLVKNINPTGADDSGHEYTMFRVNTAWDVSDATTVDTTLFHTNERQGTDENVPTGVWDIDTVDTFNLGGPGRALDPDPGTGLYPHNRNKLSHDLQEKNTQQSTVFVGNLKHRLNDDVILKWVTGFIDAKLGRVFDNDTVGGVDLLRRDNDYRGFSWSTEFRAETTNERFDLVAGVLYAQDEQKQNRNVAVSADPTASFNGVGDYLPPFPQGLGLSLDSKRFEVESLALFLDYTWHASERWELGLGGRYTHDEVTNQIASFGIAPGAGSCDPGVDIVCFFQGFENVPRPVAKAVNDFDDFSPRVVVRYNLSPESNLYASISKGYKAGGASVGNNTNANDAPFAVKFDAETLWNYELGFKSELFDNRLRLNAAVFHLAWSDLQLEAYRFLTPGDLSSNFEQTINAKDAEATGIEVEFQAMLAEGLTLSGGIGYLDTEIASNTTAELTGGFIVDLKGKEVPMSPGLTANLSAEYRWPVGGNDAWVRLGYVHRDGQYSNIEALTWEQTRGRPVPNNPTAFVPASDGFPFETPDYDVVNLATGLEMEKVSLSLYANNLFGEEYYTGTGENFGLAGIRVRPHPRTVGAGIKYRF